MVILLMLEGHAVRELLDRGVRTSGAFEFHEFFHGLSAPAFLFGSGLTFVISTRTRWQDFHQWGYPLARRVGRLLLILGLGLAIHLPYLSLRKTLLDASQQDLLLLFQCDVLHCIGIGLLVLHGLVFFFRSEERFYGLVLAATLLVCFLTPLVWDVNVLPILPAALAQLFNSQHGSPFPLFPFVGFLFAGVIVSWELTVAHQSETLPAFMRKLSLFGGGLIIGGLLVDALPWKLYPTYNFWYTSPNYFAIRLGALFLLLTLTWLLGRLWQTEHSFVTVLGRESLFVYVVHLPIIYGSVVNPTFNLSSLAGNNLAPLPTIAATLGLIIVMTGLALVWSRMKERRILALRVFQFAIAGVFLLLLFVRDN